MESVKDAWKSLKAMNKRDIAHQGLNLAMIVLSAVMIWKGLMAYTGSESPVVVVLSGSMEPSTYRGDLLFLDRGNDDFKVGEIVVYNIGGREVPIVHRILEVHTDEETGKTRLLTKGDNNRVADRGLYNPGQRWLEPEEVIGRVRGFLPHVGRLTILLTDYPFLKFVLIAVMAGVVMTSKE